MNSFEIVHHPLDRFSFTGCIGALDAKGRDSADQLLTMIGDMRFCEDNIQATCARYFLLIDICWFPRLCFLANINCAKLREYLCSIEKGEEGELESVIDDAQSSFCFPASEDQPEDAISSACGTRFGPLLASNTPADGCEDGYGLPIQKPPLIRIQKRDSARRGYAATGEKA